MRICFVCSEYPPGPHGGIGSFTQVLARALVEAGHEVRVAGVHARDYPAPDLEVDRGVTVVRLREPRTRLGWVAGRYELYRLLARWGAAGEIDVVDMPDWEGWACGWGSLPVPVAVRLNGSAAFFAAELGAKLSRATFYLERASLLRADAWSAASSYIAKKTAEIFEIEPGEVTTLYNPVDEPDGEAWTPNGADVVFTGTLTAKKGIVSLVKAWPRVLKERPDARLHVFGKDTRTRELPSVHAQLLELLGANAGTVTFHGHVDRAALRRALHEARVAVFPSYAESFGIAPFEAMGCGCPTIYTRRGPGPEVVRDGVDGLLVDPDDEGEIAGTVLRLLDDDALAARLSPAGRQRVSSRFSIRVQLPLNEAFLAGVVEGRIRRAA
ncbi:MAG TPA: glycosyltransferase family 4 protein [Thermoanaerobaculia bacterium]|nr:glycosyltransferase family 4 protein [Thermoanaerobaculia bacterium]